ncbi:hypothetical protein AAC387_Pa02g2973 [Persea americana]
MSVLSPSQSLPSLSKPHFPFSPPKSKPSYNCFLNSSTQTTTHLQNPNPRLRKSSLHPNTPIQESCNLLDDWLQLLQISIESRDFLLGLAIHACIVKWGSQNVVFQGNNLINLYVKFNRLADARQVFDEMPMRNTITWTSLINGYSQMGDLESVFRVACEMHQSGERFNEHTCSVVLQACGLERDRIRGEQVHGLVVKNGFKENAFVGTALVAMYSRSGSLDDAEMVFKGLDEINIRCWNSIILGYGKVGDSEKAIQVFCDLLDSGLEPSDYTFTNVISACSGATALDAGRQLHGLAVKYGFVFEITVANAVITMYVEYGLVEEAERIFSGMTERSLITWTALLSGYVKNGYSEKAINAFINILDLGICFDSSCLAAAVDACSKCRNLELGFQIHGIIVKLGFLSDIFVPTALIDTYTKCGDLKSAILLFNGLSCQNIASFNALLAGYMQAAGDEEEDIMPLFNQLRLTGIKPDSATFAQLLSLSADRASIVKGRCLHGYCIKVGCEDGTIVGNAIITMYAKCGSINDACRMFNNMTGRDLVTWNAMISAYALHGNGKEAVSHFEDMERNGYVPDEITLLSVLQACSYSGLFEDGFGLYNAMERRYKIELGIEHQACMVHLLGQAGKLSEAMEFIKESAFSASPLLWRTLVNACKLHGDLNFGRLASENLLNLAPHEAASYILVSNLYDRGGMLEESANVRVMMNDRNITKEVGCSWIEISNRVHRFIAGATDHPRSRDIYAKLDELSNLLKQNGWPCI